MTEDYVSEEGTVQLDHQAEGPQVRVPAAYLLRIMTGNDIVAEAPLFIYDQTLTLAMFLEAFPELLQNIPGSILRIMLMGCNDDMKARWLGQNPGATPVAIIIKTELNSPQPVIVPVNRPPTASRADRRRARYA